MYDDRILCSRKSYDGLLTFMHAGYLSHMILASASRGHVGSSRQLSVTCRQPATVCILNDALRCLLSGAANTSRCAGGYPVTYPMTLPTVVERSVQYLR